MCWPLISVHFRHFRRLHLCRHLDFLVFRPIPEHFVWFGRDGHTRWYDSKGNPKTLTPGPWTPLQTGSADYLWTPSMDHPPKQNKNYKYFSYRLSKKRLLMAAKFCANVTLYCANVKLYHYTLHFLCRGYTVYERQGSKPSERPRNSPLPF